jgi:hypothetical protein
VCGDEMVVAVHPGHGWAHRATLSLEEVGATPLVVREREPRSRPHSTPAVSHPRRRPPCSRPRRPSDPRSSRASRPAYSARGPCLTTSHSAGCASFRSPPRPCNVRSPRSGAAVRETCTERRTSSSR